MRRFRPARRNPKPRSLREQAILLYRLMERQEAQAGAYSRAHHAKPGTPEWDKHFREWSRLHDRAHATRLKVAALNQRLGQGMAETTKMVREAGHASPTGEFRRTWNPLRINSSDIVKRIKAHVPRGYSVRQGTGSQRGCVVIHKPVRFDHLEWCRVSRDLRHRFPGVDFGHTLAGESFCRYWLDLSPSQRAADDAKREAHRKAHPLPPLREVSQDVVDRALRLKRNPGSSSSHIAEWAVETTNRLVKNAEFWMGTGMTKTAALAKVFSESVAGPVIRAEVRARLSSHPEVPMKRNPPRSRRRRSRK